MKGMMTRKSFIGTMIAAGAAGCAGLNFAQRKRWYRGMLHMHSLWSDGTVLPEQALAAYRDAGYDFVSLTEHNRFSDDPDRWIRVGNGTEGGWPPRVIHPDCFWTYMERFSKTASVREKDGKKEVRMLTYGEFKRQFDSAGKFLVLPGVEITTDVGTGAAKRAMHMNVIGIDAVIERSRKAYLVENLPKHTIPAAMSETYALCEELRRKRGVRKAIYMLNHPHWPYCDILAEDMAAAPEICGFEICNNGSTQKEPDGYQGDLFAEQFWDATLVKRLTAGQGMLYAFGSDDTHTYPKSGILSSAAFADGYIMVRASELTQDAILEAISRGDFYASSELDLDDVSFDAATGTLTVSATPSLFEKLKISFITTKKGVSAEPVSYLELPTKERKTLPSRKIPLYGEGVGATVKVVQGSTGQALKVSYTLKSDDLYVRAKIESNAQTQFRRAEQFHVRHPTAWTQPYCV